MSDDLATLETQRSELMEEFLRLGDLRPGSDLLISPSKLCHPRKLE
jgi:hypothetical protein